MQNHVSEQNHVIGWDKAKINDREKTNKRKPLIEESIWIRAQGALTEDNC